MCGINPEQYAEYRRKQSEQIPPDQIDKRRDGRTVGRSRPAADTALSDRPPQTGLRQEIPRYISRHDTAAEIAPTDQPQQTAETANASTAPGINGRSRPQKPDRASWIFRARYRVGDDLRAGAARTSLELSRSALSAISKFYLISIARCDSGQLSALISANCTK